MKPLLFDFNTLRHALALVTAVSLLAAQPVLAAPTTPTADFSDNGDGTVTHKITGLTWKRCAEGQTWSGSTCSGSEKTYSWAQANARGTDGWRLPTIAELATIVERDNYKPAINAAMFPNTSPSEFWSASAYPGDSNDAWLVNFGPGNSYTFSKSDRFQARLVRGGQPPSSLGLYTPTSDFVDNGDGSVTHKKTNLTWKRCVEGQSWTGSACTGAIQTYTWRAANALGTGSWRLPTVNELQTLIEYSVAYPGPTINTTVFPHDSSEPNTNVWSASTFAGGEGNAWDVYFDNGSDTNADKEDGSQVRLVRGKQSTEYVAAEYLSGPDCLFNWAEKTYPQFFSPSGGKSQTLGEYYYRPYAGNNYLVTSSKDNHLYYILGDMIMQDAGLASPWYVLAGCRK